MANVEWLPSKDNHIYTSGATGTNAAVIRGALRAEKPDLLTVVLPQSRRMQPPESQELLEQARNPCFLHNLVQHGWAECGLKQAPIHCYQLRLVCCHAGAERD